MLLSERPSIRKGWVFILKNLFLLFFLHMYFTIFFPYFFFTLDFVKFLSISQICKFCVLLYLRNIYYKIFNWITELRINVLIDIYRVSGRKKLLQLNF